MARGAEVKRGVEDFLFLLCQPTSSSHFLLSETDYMMSNWLLFLACEGGRVRLVVMLRIPPQPLEPWAYIDLCCVTAAVFTYLVTYFPAELERGMNRCT